MHRKMPCHNKVATLCRYAHQHAMKVPAPCAGMLINIMHCTAARSSPAPGKPIVNSPAAAEASYVHAIIHRQEGQCIGEFGSGFSNANYW